MFFEHFYIGIIISMNRNELQTEYPDIHNELEYKDVTYQRHIYQNNLAYIKSWLHKDRQSYRTIEMKIWNYYEKKVLSHNQVLNAFFVLMSGYYGFQLPGDETYIEDIDIMALSDKC